MAVGMAVGREGGGGDYNGRMTTFVVLSCMMAAMGGVIFGYDIGISGGVTSMESFLKKFFPEVYTKMKEDTTISNYCKFDSQLLTSFTSSLYVAGLIASFFASSTTKAFGRKPSILVGGAAFLAGAALGGAAFNVYMLIFGRVLLGVGVGFANQEQNESSCLGIKLASKRETDIKFSDVYAVEYIDWGLVHESIPGNAGGCLLGHGSEMYRFVVHGFQRSKSQPCLWAPCVYTFGHKDLDACQMWVNQITTSVNVETGRERPKSLLVFVNPKSGKTNGCKTWEVVAPIFSCAKVNTKVIVTERAGHAFDVMSSITNKEINSYDGVIAVGGDGFFNEILNGLLSSRLKAPYPPAPTDFVNSVENGGSVMVHEANEIVAKPSDHNGEDNSPLLPGSTLNESRPTNFRTEDGCCDTDQGPEFSLPNKWFRFGLIPAGSTDAIVMCTTGTRDPITSALHIVLGKRVCLDIAQVVRWKTTSTSKDEPCVRYAASFAGYGFYGDVITESEKYRWMGPKRYDYVGTMVFLRHRSYEAEIAYLDVKSEETSSASEKGLHSSRKRALWGLPKKSERTACRVNCDVCNTKPICTSSCSMPTQNREDSKWLRSKGRFISIGAAVISCRNERAPDGLVADAHLSDGFLHLILIRDCPRPLYLWHLTQLARKGGNPLNFEFVEHHKTRAFTFTSLGKEESVWNVDGELFQAHKLSAQVFRGLISLFASGPAV